jgi:hypothetical protein
MSFKPRDYLRHILVEVEYLLDQSRTLTYERFAADETLRRHAAHPAMLGQ